MCFSFDVCFHFLVKFIVLVVQPELSHVPEELDTEVDGVVYFLDVDLVLFTDIQLLEVLLGIDGLKEDPLDAALQEHALIDGLEVVFLSFFSF